MREQVSLSAEEFTELKQSLMAKFSQEYDCEGSGEELAQAMQNMNIWIRLIQEDRRTQ